MFGGEIVGEVSERSEYRTVFEWTVKDIFSYREINQTCKSPTFNLPGSVWRLGIDPNGKLCMKSEYVGWIGVYLHRVDTSATPIDVNYRFGVKKVDGSYKMIRGDIDHVFKKAESLGWPKFLERSKLLQRKSKLAPSDDLTFICTIKLKDEDRDISMQSFLRLEKLSENLEDLFISKRGCDAKLKVQNKEFPVHRSILIARSPVLGAMFEAACIPLLQENTSVVNIVDYDPEPFEDFLKYIYTGKFTVSSGNVFQLYRIAHKYHVEKLQSDSVAYMMRELSGDSLFNTAIIAHIFDEHELGNRVQDLFNEKFNEIVHTEEWDEFLNKNMPIANKMLKNMGPKIKST